MITNDYLPRIGGIASHIAELSPAIARQGHEVQVWLLDEAAGPLPALPDVPTIKLAPAAPGIGPRRVRWSFGLARLFRAMIADFEPDILHVHTFNEMSLSMRWLGPGERRRRVFTNHSSMFLNMTRRWPGGWIARLLAGAVDGLLAPSEELLQRSSVLGLSPERSRYIPNGVDPERFRPGDRAAARRELGISGNRPVLLAARRFVRKNGLRFLAEALAEVRRQAPEVLCVFCGDACDTVELPAVQEIVAKRDLHEVVRFEGGVPNDRMPLYLAACDVMVLPSLAEATSIAGLEAMAAGRPIVGTRVGGIPALVEDGVTGRLVIAGDSVALAAAIGEVLSSGDLEAMGRAARQRVMERFTWERIAEQTVRFYQEILDKPSRRTWLGRG